MFPRKRLCWLLSAVIAVTVLSPAAWAGPAPQATDAGKTDAQKDKERDEAIEKILNWKEPETVEEIINVMLEAIGEKNDPMRNRMYFKLRMKGPEAVEGLIATLDDTSVEGGAEYAAFVLGKIADVRAIDPLLGMVNGGDGAKTAVRAASRALGDCGWGTPEETRKAVVSKALDTLIALLKHEDPDIRMDAAYSIGLLGEESAISALESAKQDEDELVRFFAEEAIERIGTKW